MRTYLMFLFVMLAINVLGQTALPENVPTPNAASIGRYGDVPVSFFTGNPGISIPLYELSVRGVTLPIRLDYDASGVQMNVLPSWTGYNWTLSAGGAITRKVNGSVDEWKPPTTHMLAGHFHRYFDCYSLLPTLSDQALADSISDTEVYDFEPDVFFFNFMGKSGKFFLGNDGQWKVNSDFDFDVIFNIHDADNYLSPFISRYPKHDALDPNQPKTIAGFRLRDTEGVTYEFGYDIHAIEYSIDFTQMGNQEDFASWKAMSWYLTKVTDRLGNVLYQLSYQRGTFFAQPFRRYECYTYTEGLSSPPFNPEEQGGYDSFGFPYLIELEAPAYLYTITAANGVTLSFNRSNSPQKMETLYYNPDSFLPEYDWFNIIKSHVQHYSDNYAFYYLQSENYSTYHYSEAVYNDKADLFSKMRLQILNSITITDHNEQNVIKFIYDTNGRMHLNKLQRCFWGNGGQCSFAAYSLFYDHYEMLPVSCLTTSSDHWGYFNDRSHGDGQHNADYYMQHKAPDAAKMKYGSLTKIVYPTGGSSLIDYEPNDYSGELSLDRQSVQSGTGFGGGLRVKSITEYDDSACTNVLKYRYFSYTDPAIGSSSGQLFAKPVYGWNNWIARQEDNNVIVTVSTVRSASIVPLSNSFGPAVGYSWVKETFGDGSNVLYHYHNLSDGPMDVLEVNPPFNANTPSPYDIFTERGYARGKLTSLAMFDASDNKVSSSTFHYRTSGMTNNPVDATNLTYCSGHVSAATYSFKGRKYKLYHQRYDLASRVDSMFYSDGTSTCTTEAYTYSDYDLAITQPYAHHVNIRPLQQRIKTRGVQSQCERYYHPVDCGDTNLISLAKEFFYLPVVSTETLYGSTLIEKVENQYGVYTVNNQTHQLLNKVSSTKHDSTETVVDVSLYTNTGQIKNYKRFNEPESWLSWACGDNYLVLKCQGNDPMANTPISNDKVFNVNAFMDEMAYRCNISYQSLYTGYSYFDHQGISSATDQRGITTFYHYNKAHQLEMVKDNDHRLLKMFEYNQKNK